MAVHAITRSGRDVGFSLAKITRALIAEARRVWLGAPTNARHGESKRLTAVRISSPPCCIPQRGSKDTAKVRRTDVEFKEKRGAPCPLVEEEEEDKDEVAAVGPDEEADEEEEEDEDVRFLVSCPPSLNDDAKRFMMPPSAASGFIVFD